MGERQVKINKNPHKNPSQIILSIPQKLTLTSSPTTYETTLQILCRFFSAEKTRVLLAVQLNNHELALFPILFKPTKNYTEEKQNET